MTGIDETCAESNELAKELKSGQAASKSGSRRLLCSCVYLLSKMRVSKD